MEEICLTPTGTATATFTGTSGGGGTGSVTVDGVTSMAAITVQAAVTSISSSPTSHYYKAGQTVSIAVNFNAAVTVSGAPKLALSDGETATYVAGSSSSSLTFNYTVSSGDTSSRLDCAATNALTLNGGEIINSSVTAILTLPAPGAAGSLGANTDLIIDTTPPTVAISPPTVTRTNGGMVSYTVTFFDAYLASTTLTPASVLKNATGTATYTNLLVTPGAGTVTTTNYTVTFLGLAGNGTLGITVPSAAASDLAGNTNVAATSSVFTVYTTPPVLTGVGLTGQGGIQFVFTNNPNASFEVLSTTNLSLPLTSWAVVGVPANNPPGVFQYAAPPATNSAPRFYLILAP